MKFWYKQGAWVSKKARNKFKNINPEDINSIAIIRHAALGDMILVRSFIVEARKFFPNASITLSIVSNYQSGTPYDLVDRVHIAIGSDKREASISEQFKVAKSLGEHDLIFDMAVTSRSQQLCLLTKAKLKISFPYRFWQRLLYDVCVYRSDLQYEAETLLDMLRLFGAKPASPPNFNMPKFKLKPELKNDKPFIIYFTTASSEDKCWPMESFAKLIKQQSEINNEYDHFILEGLAEWESVDLLMELINSDGLKQNVKALKSLLLDDTLALITKSELVVSNDTGIRHLAICHEVPTVGIFFATDPVYRYFPRYGKHDAVFEADSSIPTVDAVMSSINTIINS